MSEERLAVRAEAWGSDMDRHVLRNPVAVIGDVVADLGAFAAPAGCEMCGNCCSWGTTVPRETARALAPHVEEIARKYLPEHRRADAGWSYSARWDCDVTPVVQVGPGRKGCAFLYEKEGRYLCSIHSWALDTGRDPYDVLPFECFMIPVAVVPYDGLLHPGKSFLTIRTPANARYVGVYGPARSLRHSLLRRILHEVGRLVRRKTSWLRRGPDLEEECYFRETPGIAKEPAHRYFRGPISWYFGREFYGKFAAEMERFLEARR